VREKEGKMSINTPTTKRIPPSPQDIKAEQNRQAERERAAIKAALPAVAKGTALATPDARTAIQKWQDDNAPATAVGRLIKFSKGVFTTRDDEEPVADDIDFIAPVDQMMVGRQKFNGEGMPPDQVVGLPYDGFVTPPRESLGDTDESKWETGLDGLPADPWQPVVWLVLQRVDTSEMFTFATSSSTGRRAVGNLTKHYDRMQRTHPDLYPVVRLKVGGFQHRDERVGWVATPLFVIVGRTPKDSAAKPDTSLATQMNDSIDI
jgi:hypothetical protein